MMVQVHGPKDSGIVSFDMSRSPRQGIVYRSLAVDVNSTNERILYAGSTDDVIYKGSIKLN